MSAPRAPRDPAVGLCSLCANASVQRNRRGSAFWRCRAADTDPRLLRYPPLPVRACPAWREGEPETGGTDAGPGGARANRV